MRHYRANGKNELEEALRAGGAAITLIQNAPGLGGIGSGAHWFVIFACDSKGVYATNYNLPPFIDWAMFEALWSAPIPTIDGMAERAICC